MARSVSGGMGSTPASPWIGSSITATTRSSTAARSASRSPTGTFRKPETLGSNSRSQPALPEALMVARVRPWNAFTRVTISWAPPRATVPHFRASLMAPSLASAPVLVKKT